MTKEKFESRPTIIIPNQFKLSLPDVGGIAELSLKDMRKITVAVDMKGMIYGVEVAENVSSEKNPIDFTVGDIVDFKMLNQKSALNGKKFI